MSLNGHFDSGCVAWVIRSFAVSLLATSWARFGIIVSTTVAPFLSQLSLLGVTFGGLEMQLAGPKTDFGAQGAP